MSVKTFLMGSLRAKVFAGFAVVIGLSSVSAATYHVSMLTMRDQVDDLLDASGQSKLAAQLNTDIGEVRRSVAVYLRTGAARDLVYLHQTFEKAEKSLEPIAQGAPEEAARLAPAMKAYAGIIERIAEAVGQRQNHFATLIAEGTAAQALLPPLMRRMSTSDPEFEISLRILAAVDAGMLAATRYQDSGSDRDRQLLDAEIGRIGRESQAFRAGAPLPADLQPLGTALTSHTDRLAASAGRLIDANQKVAESTVASRNGGAAMVEAANAMISAVASKLERAGTIANDGATDTLRTGLMVMLAALVAGLGAAWLFGRGLSRPISRITGTMNALAQGELHQDVPDLQRADEIGSMARAVEVFKQNALRMRELEIEQAAQAEHAAEEQQKALEAMADKLEAEVKGMVGAASEAAKELKQSAGTMSGAVEATRSRSADASAGAEAAAGNIQMVAAAAEQLSSSINEITRQVGASTEISRRASGQVAETSAKVGELAIVADQIGEIISLVERIAGQTNLLALNATIEAARAGDAGKGFAVVASEVKGLAAQTARATEEIASQVGAIQSGSRAASQAMQTIVATIGEIDQNAASIAAAIEQQSAATQEIARNVQHAASGAGEATRNIAGVLGASAEAGEQAATVERAAERLSDQSASLGHSLDGFLDGLRGRAKAA